jgi:membrane protease YdiL (CAAX protease family)
MLLFLPLVTVATAPFVWSAVVAVGCSALLSIEARTAALGCVRWQDDGETFDRETPVWRALLVFTAFQATQALALQILGLSALAADDAVAIAYVASAVVLLALTFYEQGGRTASSLLPVSAFVLVAGVLGGLVSGALALGYGRLVASLGIDVPRIAVGPGRYAMAAALVLAAPIAEETFFRGWLQDVVHLQYERRGHWFAVGVTAFAFAAIHPPLSFVPVFVLGLVTGVLRASSGSITAGIVAHALHNAIVLFLPPS